MRELASFNTPRGGKFNREYEIYSQRFRREDLGRVIFRKNLLHDPSLTIRSERDFTVA